MLLQIVNAYLIIMKIKMQIPVINVRVIVKSVINRVVIADPVIFNKIEIIIHLYVIVK